MDQPKDPTMEEPGERVRALSRRSLLVGLGAAGVGALVAACTNSASSGSSPTDTGRSSGTTSTTSSTTTTAPGVATPVQCVLTPEQTEGPYFIDADLVRRDITEGRPGVPLLLSLTVANATTCIPIPNAIVDVWHCDAAGSYSGFDASAGGSGGGGTTATRYLRGVQTTNAAGVAEIQTIYPGWYRGRTVHIHVKVHVGGREIHTGQLYFPGDVTGAVYQQLPYSSRPGRDTMNAADGVYRSGGAQSMLTLRKEGSSYVASLTMGVRFTGGTNPL